MSVWSQEPAGNEHVGWRRDTGLPCREGWRIRGLQGHCEAGAANNSNSLKDRGGETFSVYALLS